MTVPTSPASGSNPTDQGGDAQLPPPTEMVTMTIDGLPVRVPKGSLVIRAAEQVGIEIPRFCDHPLLEPAGACRQCLVDVAMPGPEGTLRPMPKPQASCTMTVTEGMSVATQRTSPVADKAQHGVMEMLLINHPLDCPVCDKGGECPLQNQAMTAGRAVSRFTDVKRTFPKPIHISSQVLLDRERCIMCQRCTRFSDQIAGDPFIVLVERGAQQQIGTYQDKPFESYFSGNTVQICPVGALTGAMYRFRSRPFDLVSTPTACEHCASGCALRTDHRRGTVLRRLAGHDPAVNEEWNCDKGRWAFQYATRPDRLEVPLVREDGELRPASWPQALALAAQGLQQARSAAGAGVLAGGRLTAEDAYAYGKFARVALRTNDVDFRARPHSAEEAQFLAAHVVGTGPGAGGVTYAELEHATSVLLVGFEPEEESPIVFLRLRKAARRNKTSVYAIAPFGTRGLTKLAGTLIQAAPGTEAQVLGALARADGEFEVPGRALSEGAIILAGERLAGVPGGFSALTALAEHTGARIAWVPRRAGERGALEAGLLPNLLPGGRLVADPAARVQVAQAWGCQSLVPTPGRDTDTMLHAAAAGELAALVVGGVELADLPSPGTARAALERAFVVSLEVRASDVTELADVVLPVAPAAEKAGTFVDWEGRPRHSEQALHTAAMPDHRVLAMVADELDTYIDTITLTQTRNDMAALGPWTGERGAAPSVPARAPSAVAVGEGQVVLATWHHLLDAGRLQDGEPHLAGTAPLAVARLSAATASSLGVHDGDAVTVSTGRGSITLPLVVTAMSDDVVWLPTNSVGSPVRATLGAAAGDVVTLSKGDAP